MHVVAISNDLVRLSFLAALLADAGIEAIELDGFASSVAGGIDAIPRRLAVRPQDRWRAEHVLAEAGESMHQASATKGSFGTHRARREDGEGGR